MLWCRTACGYMWITRSPSTYPQKSRRRWRAGPRPASVAPMNDYEPIPGEPTATMFQSLEQIRRQTLQRCTATVGQSDRQLLFGMTTALELQGVPVPSLQSRHGRAACHGADALRQASYSTVEIRPGHCPHLEPLHSAITHPHIEWRARIARVSCVGAAVLISFDRESGCARRFHSRDAGAQWRAGRGQIVSGVAAFHKRDAAVPRKKHLQASHDTGTPQCMVSRRKLATAGRSTPRNTGWTMQCRGSWNHLSFRSSHFAGHRMGRVQGRSGI